MWCHISRWPSDMSDWGRTSITSRLTAADRLLTLQTLPSMTRIIPEWLSLASEKTHTPHSYIAPRVQYKISCPPTKLKSSFLLQTNEKILLTCWDRRYPKWRGTLCPPGPLPPSGGRNRGNADTTWTLGGPTCHSCPYRNAWVKSSYKLGCTMQSLDEERMHKQADEMNQ